MSNLEVRINGDASGALSAFVKVGEGGREMATEFGRHALEMATAALGIKSALESVVEGIKKADELRDLALSLNVFTGSAEKGTEALKFFEEQARNTRDTGDELAGLFRDALPQAVARGFSQDTMQHVTVWLSQLGTIAGKSTEEMVSGFEQLLAGKVSAGKNPLLKVLGITKADADSLGWENVIQKMEDVSEHFPQFGQSFESTLKKAKEELLHTFGDGFNEARGQAGKGMDAINIAIESSKPYIKDLGKAFAEFIPTVIRGFEGAAGAIRVFIGGLETGAGLIIGVVAKVVDDIVGTSAGAIATLLEQLSAFWHALPPEALAAIKVMNPAIDLGELDKGAAKLDTWAGKIRGAVDSFHSGAQGVIGFGAERMEHGADQVREGIEMITKAQQPLAAATDKSSQAVEKLTQNLSALGKVKIDPEAAGKALKEFNELVASATKLQLTLQRSSSDEQYKALISLAPDGMTKATLEYERQIIDLFNRDAQERQKIEAIQVKLNEAIQKFGDSAPQVGIVRSELEKSGQALMQLNSAGKELATGQYLKNALQGAYDLADPDVIRAIDALTKLFSGVAFSTSSFNPLAVLHQQLIDQQQISSADFVSAGQIAPDLATALTTGVIHEGLGATLARQFTDALRDFWQKDHLGQRLTGDMAIGFDSLIVDLGTSGGRKFGEVATQTVSSLSRDFLGGIASTIRADLIGRPGDSSKGTGEIAGHFYDSQGQDITRRSNAVQGALVGLEVGYGGYQAGLSGQSGARSGATLSGAASGAAIGTQIQPGLGTVIGAAIGAIAGAIGAAIGAAERQSEYKYGVPSIVGGVAQFTGDKNIQPAQKQQIIAQLQEIYDGMWDSLVLTLAKIPGAMYPQRGTLGGAIQPNPSGHFMEHLQQFDDQTLPRAELALFGNETQRLLQTMGMSAARSAEIWGYLEHIDPKKAVGLIDSLFSALEQHSKLTTYWGGSDLAHATTPVSNEKLDFATNALWWGQNQSRLSITSSFDDVDTQLLQLSGALDQLSESGRIQAFGQIVQLEEKRDNMMRQAAQDLYSLWKTVHDEASSDLDTLKIAGMKRSDGSPDNEAIASFYRHKSEQDLFAISGASNAGEARAAWENFRRDVMQAFQAGSSIVAGTHKWDDPTMPGLATATSGFDWNKWATNFLGLGQGEVEGAVHRFGGQIDDLNTTFNSKLDPAINDFITKATDVGGKFDDVGGAIDRVIEPIDRFTIRINSTGDSLSRLEAAVDSLVSRLSAARVNGTSASGNNNIVAKTLAQRMLA